MGSPEFSVPILSSIISAGHDVVAVYCQPPRPAGRGKKERLTPVHSRALELGLDVRHPVNFKSKEAVSDFAALKADIAVVVTKHDGVDEKKILASAPYVFDTTGKVKGAKGL